MVYREFGDLKSQIEGELDTQDETFVQDSEIQGYFNTAVVISEATIVKLGLREKYLQREYFLSTVQGTKDYALPTDIVATKIRKVIYRNGTLIYESKPLRGESSYEVEDVEAIFPPNEYYHYTLYKNNSMPMFRITPVASLTVTNAFRIVYFASLQKYTQDSDLCDLPDICYEFVMSYVRYRIYMKETHVNTPDEKANMQMHLQLMTELLQNQVADPTMDEMDRDYSHYEEMS